MNREERQRLQWVKLYEQTNDAGLTCRRCGISRPTLRKWWKRYQEFGEQGLVSHSRKPLNSPNSKITPEIECLVLLLRKERKLGARRLQSELKRLHEVIIPFLTVIYSRIPFCISQFLHRGYSADSSIRSLVVICP